jgi:hypothetical protein
MPHLGMVWGFENSAPWLDQLQHLGADAASPALAIEGHQNAASRFRHISRGRSCFRHSFVAGGLPDEIGPTVTGNRSVDRLHQLERSVRKESKGLCSIWLPNHGWREPDRELQPKPRNRDFLTLT